MYRIFNPQRLYAGLAASLFAANGIWLFKHRVNGDVAWYLYAAQRLRDGAVLYKDLPDFNLPMAFLSYLPYAYLAPLLHLPIQAVMYAGLWLITATILFFVDRKLAAIWEEVPRRLFLLVVASAALSMNRLDFGQRDPLAGLLFVPLVISVYGRIQGVQPTFFTALKAVDSGFDSLRSFVLDGRLPGTAMWGTVRSSPLTRKPSCQAKRASKQLVALGERCTPTAKPDRSPAT
jgi:hypothetical protein